MHRFLAIGLAVAFTFALCGEAAAWSWPADGAVLRPYALGTDLYAGGQHRGVDVAGPDGSDVHAPAAGVVTFAGSLPTYGRGVTILTSDGYAVTLVHLGTIGVAKGDTVSEGATLGTMGTSGTPEQSVPSVHLGIRRAAEEEGYVDPLGLLPPRATAPTPPATAPAPVQAAPPVVAPQPTPPAAPPAPVPSSPPASTAGAVAVPAAPAGPSVAAPAAPAALRPPAVAVAVPAVDDGQAPTDEPVIETTAQGLTLTASATGMRAAAPAHARVDAGGVFRSDVRATERRAPVELRPPASPVTVPAPAGSADGAPAFARGPARLVPGDARPESVGVAPGRLDVAPDGRSGPVHLAVTRTARESTAGHRAPPPASGEARRPGPSGAVRLSAGAGSGPGVRFATVDPAGATGLPELAAALALAVLAAAAVGRWVARRIGMDGAVLRDNADLLRQLDATHRARVHDRGRGRVRAPSAAARS